MQSQIAFTLVPYRVLGGACEDNRSVPAMGTIVVCRVDQRYSKTTNGANIEQVGPSEGILCEPVVGKCIFHFDQSLAPARNFSKRLSVHTKNDVSGLCGIYVG